MKTFSSAIVVLFASSAPFSTAESGNSLEQCFPDDIPWYTYQGKDYIFSRMKYNSVCVDSHGKQYQWGKVEGTYPPIDEPDSGCSKTCVSGYGRGQARGCTSMKPNKLVGFNYNCDEDACYCLYEKNTWSGNNSPCFDSIDTGNHGHGDVAKTQVEVGSTCYSLDVQPAPAPAPAPARDGSSICTRSPDYDCYKTGRPACCSQHNGKDCPSFMTICDNHASGTGGTSYCTYGPDYGCYRMGWPSCCDAKGGPTMNCPMDEPSCDTSDAAAADIAASKLVKYLRANE